MFQQIPVILFLMLFVFPLSSFACFGGKSYNYDFGLRQDSENPEHLILEFSVEGHPGKNREVLDDTGYLASRYLGGSLHHKSEKIMGGLKYVLVGQAKRLANTIKKFMGGELNSKIKKSLAKMQRMTEQKKLWRKKEFLKAHVEFMESVDKFFSQQDLEIEAQMRQSSGETFGPEYAVDELDIPHHYYMFLKTRNCGSKVRNFNSIIKPPKVLTQQQIIDALSGRK